MKSFGLWIEFHLSKGPIDNKSALVQVMAWRQAITLTNADPVPCRIYAELGGDELKEICLHSKGEHFKQDRKMPKLVNRTHHTVNDTKA